MDLPGLRDKVAVVTGAASGIGLATSRLFAAAGAKVVLADWRYELVEEAARGLPSAATVACDVSSEQDVRRMIDVAIGAFDRVDILFNNAGVGPSATGKYAMNRLVDTSEANWDAVLGVNLRGVAFGCKHALPVMARQQSGVIINNASVNALIGSPGSDAYTASKGAIVSLTRSLAAEWGRHGVRINCICPGGVDTPMGKGPSVDPETRARYIASAPMHRSARPEEVAGVVLFLASDLASWVHGAIIPVDGGYTAV